MEFAEFGALTSEIISSDPRLNEDGSLAQFQLFGEDWFNSWENPTDRNAQVASKGRSSATGDAIVQVAGLPIFDIISKIYTTVKGFLEVRARLDAERVSQVDAKLKLADWEYTKIKELKSDLMLSGKFSDTEALKLSKKTVGEILKRHGIDTTSSA